MKLYEITDPTLEFEVEHGDWNQQRIFIKALLQDDAPDWIKKARNNKPILVVEATVDLNQQDKVAYVNHIVSHRKGSGYAPKTLQWIAEQLKSHSFKEMKCYIEHTNASSRSMISKVGFKQDIQDKHGDYFIKKLE